jgi:hypothetical protein
VSIIVVRTGEMEIFSVCLVTALIKRMERGNQFSCIVERQYQRPLSPKMTRSTLSGRFALLNADTRADKDNP